VYLKVYLKKNKDAAVRRNHPWIFSGAIQRKDKGLKDGDIVDVFTYNEKYLATGYYQNNTITVRVLSFVQREIDFSFWLETIENAFKLRQRLDLTENASTNAYRLLHAEGDNVSGLIIDIYNDTAVIQCHSIGIHQRIDIISKALKEVLGDRISVIYDKSKKTLPKQYAQSIENKYLIGENPANTVLENDQVFKIDWEKGQKTGFFLDQRDNRQLLAQYTNQNTVLNTFCYSGGFSIYALAAGATLVHSVDVSKTAIELTDENVALNDFKGEHESFAMDVLQFLKESEMEYDVVVVDPPAYAKSIKARHNAVQGYKRLNKEALKKVKSGGLMFTFSCSQVVDRVLFYNTILAAALESKRKIKVLHHLSQPADHPVNIFHPESSYLKGLVLYVE
jgi:23S rRNA (cytosine1962-C5)-methyltransferase